MPWHPIHIAELTSADGGGRLRAMAERTGHTTTQLALAWLLTRSRVVLAIPGTSSVAHLEENMASASIDLDDAMMSELDALSAPGRDPERIGPSR